MNGFRRRKDFRSINVRPIAFRNLWPWLGLFTELGQLVLNFHVYLNFHPFQSSPYNSCRDWSKTWCFVDLFFLSFSTANKCDERQKHVGYKHTLRATQCFRLVTTAFWEFVRDYWLLSYPVEANRELWREDINAGRILFGQTSYSF